MNLLIANAGVLIVNFNGIGNVLMIYPLLRQLAKLRPDVRIFVQQSPIFYDTSMSALIQLPNLAGLVPSIWRRFEYPNWSAIDQFIQSQNITNIINLRNEGPTRDQGYVAFKQERFGMGSLDFWDLHDDTFAHGQLVYKTALWLFARHGIDLADADRHWLRQFHHKQSNSRRKIGMFLGASQSIKRWPITEWWRAADNLLDDGIDNLLLFAGDSPVERNAARRLYIDLLSRWGKRVDLLEGQSLYAVVEHIADLDLLVSNDSMPVHAASALGIPVLGLYLSTDSAVWGSGCDYFNALQSRIGLECPCFKPDSGNCGQYYDSCPSPCHAGIGHKAVVARVRELLAHHSNF